MENELAIREKSSMFAPLTIHKAAQFALKEDNPSLAVLGAAFGQPYRALLQIHSIPSQGKDFALKAPSGEICEGN